MTDRLAEFEKALDRLIESQSDNETVRKVRRADVLLMYRDSQATVEHYHGRTVELENFCPWCKRIDGGHQAECGEIQRRLMEDESLRPWVRRLEDAVLEQAPVFVTIPDGDSDYYATRCVHCSAVWLPANIGRHKPGCIYAEIRERRGGWE